MGYLCCDKCKFEINQDIRPRMYVVLPGGEWEYLPRRGTVGAFEELTDKKWDYERLRENGEVGLAESCFCFACHAMFEVDADEERHICENCGSDDVKSARGIVDERCPICNQGVMRYVEIPGLHIS